MAKNESGLPDQLKLGIENLSGVRLDGVKIHYNSSVPAQLNAQAYTQGTDIHLGPGQQRHLPHEAWHVVQQAQGRVSEGAGSHIGPNREPEARSVEPDLLTKRTPR